MTADWQRCRLTPQQHARDALKRWNVGSAREWHREIVTADHVPHALQERSAVNGWAVAEEQLLADALIIADWLHEARFTDDRP